MNHLGDWTSYWARRTPDSVAIVEATVDASVGGAARRWTWRELDRRANRLAHALESGCGVRKGDRVAVLAHNAGEHFEILFACAKIGALFVPLNWRLALAELEGVLADAGPRVLIHDQNNTATALALTVPRRIEFGRAYDDLLAPASDGPAGGDVDLEDPLVLMYSSGTTGKPKGVLMAHRQLLFNSLTTQLAIGVAQTDSALVFLPLFHTGGLNCLATPLLHHGGRVVLMNAFDPERALAIAERERITLHMGVPTIFQMLRDAPSFARADLSSARLALCGGAPCPLGLIETWRERGISFRQGYGLTEVGPNCFSLTGEDAFRKAGTVGWPNFYVRAKIVDDDGREVGANTVGELALAGPMVSLGYFRNPQATRDAFRGGPWFHTGDLVRRDDEGYHTIVDRKKEMFISGGENVYPAEVERALAEIEGVAEACVIGVPDERWGEVGRAVVVLGAGARLDGGAILRALDGRLARYKIPKSVAFTDALPRNPTGKVVRPDVRRRFGGAQP